MNTRVDTNQTMNPADIAKTIVAVLVAAAALFAFYWFGQWPAAIRGAGLVVALLGAAGIFLLTSRGRQFLEFFNESRFELRKVYWPSKDETLKTTGLIIIVVIIVSLLLWAFDLVIASAVRFLLGT